MSSVIMACEIMASVTIMASYMELMASVTYGKCSYGKSILAIVIEPLKSI